jgi:GTP-binding protein Era
MEERGGVLYVQATILVERESQKGIVIGRKGSMLGTIGREARLRIEALYGMRAFLELRVAVLEDWSRDPRHLEALGYSEE